jgi:PadR family transcriptional regulator PadR
MAKTNPPFMSGVPELLVLRQLVRQEMYGYELAKAIRAGSGDVIALGEGVIYPVLHGLEKRGALTATRKTYDGRTRVYYSVSAQGRKRLESLTGAWKRIRGGIESVLQGAAHA